MTSRTGRRNIPFELCRWAEDEIIKGNEKETQKRREKPGLRKKPKRLEHRKRNELEEGREERLMY